MKIVAGEGKKSEILGGPGKGVRAKSGQHKTHKILA